MSNVADNFTEVQRTVGMVWLHKTKPVWVVEYPYGFNAYVVRDYELPVPKGRTVWTLDNRRLSDKLVQTLEEAMKLADDCPVQS